MPAEASDPAVGDVVDGRYELTGVIGAGGMGQVWSGHDRQLESACAIKFILGHMAHDKAVRTRFTREAKAVAALRNPHVVQVFGLGEHRGVPYIAMELLEGETLRGRLDRLERLDAHTTLAIIEQVVHGLERARSSQIVHRDLKPENIWLCADHDVFVKLLDFGVAKAQLMNTSMHTGTGTLLGTPYYMSPEQAYGKTAVDYRSDLWAVAIIAIECLGGRRPFESESLSALLISICTTTPPALAELAPHLPAGLQSFWERGLAREPENRFQSGAELLESLRRGLLEAPRSVRHSSPNAAAAVSVTPVSSAPPPPRDQDRLRHVLAIAAGIGITIVLVITALRLFQEPESALDPALAPSELAAPTAAAQDLALAPASKLEAPAKAKTPEPAVTPMVEPIANDKPSEKKPEPSTVGGPSGSSGVAAPAVAPVELIPASSPPAAPPPAVNENNVESVKKRRQIGIDPVAPANGNGEPGKVKKRKPIVL